MPRNVKGIGRTGKKHKKPASTDNHRQPKNQGAIQSELFTQGLQQGSTTPDKDTVLIPTESEGARPTHPRARAVTLHICSVGPARLRPPSHLTTAPRLLRPSLAHLVPPAPAHARDPLCSPTRWAQVLVSGSTGSYLQGSCRSSR